MILRNRLLELAGILTESIKDDIDKNKLGMLLEQINIRFPEQITGEVNGKSLTVKPKEWILEKLGSFIYDYLRSKHSPLPNTDHESYVDYFSNLTSTSFSNLFKDTNFSDLFKAQFTYSGDDLLNAIKHVGDWFEDAGEGESTAKYAYFNMLKLPASDKFQFSAYRDLRALGLDVAISIAKEWNNSIPERTRIESTAIEKEARGREEILKEYNNDSIGGLTLQKSYVWVDLHTTNCRFESERMGHCGRDSSADTIYSLRQRNVLGEDRPYVTVSLTNEGKVIQCKGSRNSVPSPKYEQYIVDLLVNSGSSNWGGKGIAIKGYSIENPQGDWNPAYIKNSSLYDYLEQQKPTVLTEDDKTMRGYIAGETSFEETRDTMGEGALIQRIIQLDNVELFKKDLYKYLSPESSAA